MDENITEAQITILTGSPKQIEEGYKEFKRTLSQAGLDSDNGVDHFKIIHTQFSVSEKMCGLCIYHDPLPEQE
jgi:hypothetical protein